MASNAPQRFGIYASMHEQLNETAHWVSKIPPQQTGSKRAWLTVITGSEAGRVFPLATGNHVIGRSSGVEIQLSDEAISRNHTRLHVSETGTAYVMDCGSKNGTMLGSRSVGDEPVELRDGSKIQIGGAVVVRFSFRDSMEESFERELYDSANRDHLTGAFNKRYFDNRLATDFSLASRQDRCLSLILFDLDDFKQVNDRHGHAAGDHVLQEVVKRLSASLREGEFLARIGGEEFAVLVNHADLGATVVVAERLRGQLSSQGIEWQGHSIEMSASFGVAVSANSGHLSPEELMRAADVGLYRAKRAGKNRVCGPGR